MGVAHVEICREELEGTSSKTDQHQGRAGYGRASCTHEVMKKAPPYQLMSARELKSVVIVGIAYTGFRNRIRGDVIRAATYGSDNSDVLRLAVSAKCLYETPENGEGTNQSHQQHRQRQSTSNEVELEAVELAGLAWSVMCGCCSDCLS